MSRRRALTGTSSDETPTFTDISVRFRADRLDPETVAGSPLLRHAGHDPLSVGVTPHPFRLRATRSPPESLLASRRASGDATGCQASRGALGVPRGVTKDLPAMNEEGVEPKYTSYW
jgi:hypothetical protein